MNAPTDYVGTNGSSHVVDSAYAEDYELRHYWRVLGRHKLIVVLPVVLLAVAGFALGKDKKPIYESSAQVLTQSATPQNAGAGSGSRSGSGAAAETGPEHALLASDAVRTSVETALHRPVDVTVTASSENANVAVVTAASADPANAVKDANLYADTYVWLRHVQLAKAADETKQDVRANLAAVDAQIASLDPPVKALDAQIIATYDSVVRNGLENQREELLLQRESLDRRRAALQGQLDSLEVASTNNPVFGIGIVSHASEAVKAEGPKKRRYALAGAGIGFVLGLVLAFGREHFDDLVSTKRDLEVATGGAPVLGVIPRVRRSVRAPLVIRSKPRSPAAEAYRKLRTSLQLASKVGRGRHRVSDARDVRVIMITSPNSRDGKTTTVANLGIAMASLGHRMLVVDANLHRPRLHAMFGLSNDSGLTSVLSSEATLDEAVQAVPGANGLRVLTAGPAPADPAALLSTEAAVWFVDAVASNYDIVLLDGPPLLPVTDGLVLASLVEGVVLVASSERTRREDVVAAMESLEQSGTVFLGSVLCGVDRKEARLSPYRDRRYTPKHPPRSDPSPRDESTDREPALVPPRTASGFIRAARFPRSRTGGRASVQALDDGVHPIALTSWSASRARWYWIMPAASVPPLFPAGGPGPTS